MDALKRLKTAERTSCTRSYNALKDVLENTGSTSEEIELSYNLFKNKDDKLEVTHQAYLNSLHDDKEFDSEYKTIESYRDKSVEMALRVKKALNELKPVVPNAQDTNISQGTVNGIVNYCTETRRNPRLPEIELKKFNGDIKEYLTFRSQFEKIHTSEHLTNAEKFHYLLQSTEENSPPRELIKSFPVTNDNYLLAYQSLEDRYGKDDLLIEVYVRELISLVLSNANKNKSNFSLTSLYNRLSTQLRCLSTLGVTNDKCAVILFPLVENCLPLDILKNWERERVKLKNTDNGTHLDALLAYLKQEVESSERIKISRADFTVSKKDQGQGRAAILPSSAEKPTYSASELLVHNKADDKFYCVFCPEKSNHESRFCRRAFSIPLAEKTTIIKKNGLCFQCLGQHLAKNCRSKVKCNKCSKKHLKFMCPSFDINKSTESNEVDTDKISNKAESSDSLHTYPQNKCNVFLQTLVVKLKGANVEKDVRLLCDTGSQKSYILKSTAVELGYKSQGEHVITHSLFGGTKTDECRHQSYKIYLGNLMSGYVCNLDVLDQGLICKDIPSVSEGPWLRELRKKKIIISDVGKSNMGPIEVLLGSDVLGKLYTGRKETLSSGLVALETKLGWTLSGKIPSELRSQHVNMSVISMLSQSNALIPNLWDLELIGIRDPVEQRSKEETKQAVLLHFQETVRVKEDGRYEVNMPWKFDHAPLPDNYELAKKRLDSTCKKLEKEGFRKEYHQVLEDWKKEGIIEEVPDAALSKPGHYLAHLPVIKEHSTTPLRICFDASAKTPNGPSLNDCLEIGVNLIEKIPSIMTRFRLYKIGVVSDIRKAFLQISLHPNERDFLRFLWYDEEGRLKILRHARVVFGVCSSPFLLGAVIEHHLMKEALIVENSFTKCVIKKLKDSYYVDNCVTSINSESNLEPFIREATEIMKKGQFDLRGWENTALGNCRVQDPTKLNVLGLVWNKQTDTLELSSEGLQFDENEKVTKRKILSLLNKIYDPIGFTTPVLLLPKRLLQSVWKDKTPWDAEVDEETKKKFLKWTKELPYLVNIRIPRWIGASNESSMSLHIFCDASQIAYAAMVFVRCESRGGITVQLLQAKSRISPMKNITIPRMELLSATIAARLFNSVKDSLKLNKIQTFFWTDSSTVLTWIKRQEPWSVFVTNRITEIRRLTSSEDWSHIPGEENPADLLSRGCGAKRLSESRFWEGPDWLKLPPECWPKSSVNPDERAVESEKRRTVVSANNTEVESVIGHLLKRISSLTKIIRVIAWIMRFRPAAERSEPNLTSEEYSRARKILFRCVQNESFQEEAEKKSLKNLSAYRDEDGILRMRTRLTNEEETQEFLSPIILPSKHLAVKRLIEQQHLLQGHAGTLTLLTMLRNKFWIVKGRRTVKSVIQSCTFCRRYQAQSLKVPFPPLPKDRTSLSHTFQVTGVDLAGPLIGKSGEKHWIVIFTCALYRAVHLELIPSLSTPAFILALRRFIARRGRISVLYSDNGTNFVGLNRALKKLNWNKIQREFEVQQIKWKFNPPSAPWWGGFWERLIRILKDLLRKNLGRAALELDEIATLVIECESIMNGRPLTYVSDEPEIRTLTPAMFLQSLPGNEMPELDIVEGKSLVKRFQYIQKLRENLKQRFKKEYLGFLRSSNSNRTDTIQVGDVVLIGSDDKKRLVWPLAVVKEIYPGKDNISRLVKVKTSNGTFLRPIQRLYPLEVRGEDRRTEFQLDPGRAVPMPESEPEQNENTRLLSEPAAVKTRSGRTVKPPQKFNF